MLLKMYEVITTLWLVPFKPFLSQSRSFKFTVHEAYLYSLEKVEYALNQEYCYRINIVVDNTIVAQWNGSPTVGDFKFTQQFRDILTGHMHELENEVQNLAVATNKSDGLVERIEE